MGNPKEHDQIQAISESAQEGVEAHSYPPGSVGETVMRLIADNKRHFTEMPPDRDRKMRMDRIKIFAEDLLDSLDPHARKAVLSTKQLNHIYMQIGVIELDQKSIAEVNQQIETLATWVMTLSSRLEKQKF